MAIVTSLPGSYPAALIAAIIEFKASSKAFIQCRSETALITYSRAQATIVQYFLQRTDEKLKSLRPWTPHGNSSHLPDGS